MGLFSRKKTFIESSSQLLLEETPNLVKDSIFTSVLNNTNIPEDITANYLGSLHVKGKRMRAYAEDHYPYGLPNGTLNYPTASNAKVKTAIETDLGITVQVMSTLVDIASPLWNSSDFLYNTRDWDIETNVVSNPPFNVSYEVLLFDVAFVSGTESTITYTYTRPGASNDHNEAQDVIEYRTETRYHPEVFTQEVYYYATYYETEYDEDAEEYVPIGDLQFWSYRVEDNTYLELGIPSEIEESSRYYPVVPIRRNKVDLTSESRKDTELYKTSKRMLNMWGVDIDSLGDGVNGSPDIKDVDHSYVVIAVDIADDSQSVYNYLYEYFLYLLNRSQYTKQDYTVWELQGLSENETPPVNVVTVSDAGYRMDLAYNYIEVELVQGSIGDVGSFEREVIATDRITNDYFGYETSRFIVRKQLTTNFYQEITVYGLYHINYVYSNATVDTSLQDAFNREDEKNNFLIPINVDVSDNVSRFFSNELVYYSLRIVFNSKITKKLKWYQTGFFQIVIKIVAVVLTIYGAYQLGAALVAAAAVGVVAVAQVIITAVLISVAINYALKFLVSVIGLESVLVIILVMAAAAYGGYNVKIGSIGSYELPTAIDLMQVSNVALSEFNNVVTDEVQAVLDEMTDFNEYAAELYEELEEESFDMDSDLYSLNVFQTSMGAYETPEEFLFRTSYNDNVGVLALEAPATFVDKLLKLDIPSNDINLDI